jgi:hypothetical protein
MKLRGYDSAPLRFDSYYPLYSGSIIGQNQNRTLAIMVRTLSVIISSCCFVSGVAFAQAFEADFKTLIEASCIHCHDAETKTPLNMENLDYDLGNPVAFAQMVKIFDRLQDREMPPRSEPRPKRALLNQTLASLKSALLDVNLAAREDQRVSLRRLSRIEYEYTIQDLLGIHDNLGRYLAADIDSVRFDTVAAGQQISPIHVQSYLETADRALDSAIPIGRRPPSEPVLVDYVNSRYVKWWYDMPYEQAGNRIKQLDDAVVVFEAGEQYLRTDHCGFRIRYPGLYRIRVEASAYQAFSPVTAILVQTNEKLGGRRVLGAFDLHSDETRSVEFTTFMQPNDFLYPIPGDLDEGPDEINLGRSEDHAKTYKGEGVAIKSLTIQGPLAETWPPPSARQLLTGVEFVERDAPEYSGPAFDIKLSKEPIEHVRDIVARLACGSRKLIRLCFQAHAASLS